MAFEKVSWIWKERTYFLIWLITTLVIGGVYSGLQTDPKLYGAIEWVFALVFPVLVGATVAVQVANYREQKSCPLNATSGGMGGTVLGILTVACPSCPAILAGWIGLGAAVPSAFLASPWLKLASLLLLVVSLSWASRER